MDDLHRFASRPDEYQFTLDDAMLVVTSARGHTSYTSTNGRLTGPFQVYGQEVRTAGDLRKVLRENPPAPEKYPAVASDSQIQVNVIHSLVNLMVKMRSMIKLLLKKGVISQEEWIESLDSTTSVDYWAFYYGQFLKSEAFEKSFQDWIAQQVEADKSQPLKDLPPPPSISGFTA